MKEQAITIETSELNHVQFRKKDYLQSIESISKDLRRRLKQAVTLNNTKDDYVSLVFRSEAHGKLKVMSAVLMLGSHFIVLQSGRTLPIGSVEQVIF